MDSRLRRKSSYDKQYRVELIELIQGLRSNAGRNQPDCKELISIIMNDHACYTNMLLKYCRDLLRRLGSPSIHHSFRETNTLADALARER